MARELAAWVLSQSRHGLCVSWGKHYLSRVSLDPCKTEKGGGDGPDFSATFQPSFSMTRFPTVSSGPQPSWLPPSLPPSR